jgi:hypothetical protein
LRRHASTNRRILDEYFPDSDNRLFPKPDFDKYEDWEGLSLDRMAVTLARAMIALKEDQHSSRLVRALEKIERKLIEKINDYPSVKRLVQRLLNK